CENIDHDENGVLRLWAPAIDTATIDDFPSSGGGWLNAAVCLLTPYDEVEAGAEHVVNWEVRAASGWYYRHGVRFELEERSAWHHPGEEGRLVLPVKLEFDPPEAGKYLIDFRVDGAEPYTIWHYIVR